MQIIDDLKQLLAILPDGIRQALEQHPQRESLIEVVLDLGRPPEARFPQGSEYLSEATVTHADLQHCVERVGGFGGDNRAGLERTLHRISAIRNRRDEVIGLTCRVGRAVFGTIGIIRDLVESGRSILMLGRPGVGKTTALREIARVLADELHKRVVIIDTSNEIAGDGDIPHPAIGRSRRMQVARPELQHQVMIEAVENHMPEVIVIDEIGTELEALAARTIAERGVQLVGTAHGNSIDNLIKNPTLSDLVGGIQSVTLGDEEARRRGSQKSVLERKAPPTFDIAVEMLDRHQWVVHQQVAETIDALLRGHRPALETRTLQPDGEVTIAHTAAVQPPSTSLVAPAGAGGWRASGRMVPLGQNRRDHRRRSTDGFDGTAIAPSRFSSLDTAGNDYEFARMLDESLPRAGGFTLTEVPLKESILKEGADPERGNILPILDEEDWEHEVPAAVPEAEVLIGPNGEDLPLRLYPYGVSRQHLDQVIRTLNLPIGLTKDIDHADAVLALRSHIKNHAKLRQLARSRQLPIHAIKTNTIPQIAHTLRRLLDMDKDPLSQSDLGLLYQGQDEDELEALEETRLAVEQIVIPKGQPVELLPRSARVRKMQHELVEHYRLKSHSFGEEPNRRIRIYPA